MNLQSHLLLAMMIESQIKERYGVSLRSDAFYYGNIRPDLTPRGLKRYPHTFQDSMPIFRHKCYLLYLASRMMRPPMYLLSYRLGVILHYTADFFTLAHNDMTLFYNRKEHFKYENELYRVLWKGERRRPPLPSAEGLRLDAYLRLVRQAYFKGPQGPEHDADYIYSVCLEVAGRMIERIYLEREIRPKGKLRCYVARIRNKPPEIQWQPYEERMCLQKEKEAQMQETIDRTMRRLEELKLITRENPEEEEESE